MGLKQLTDEIQDLAYWLNEYCENFPDNERAKAADVAHLLIILRRLIILSPQETLDQIQI